LERVLDRLCEKSKRVTQSQGGEEHLKYYKRRKGNGIDRHFLLKNFVERKVEGTETRGRRRKQLLNNLTETKRFWKLQEEEPESILWKIRFGKDYGPVLRESNGWRY
jgi:hypothetical protein